MKIAFVVTHFPQLSETFILNQITGLIDRGHDVDIYAHSPSNEPKVHPDIERYDLLKRTYYYGSFYQSMPDSKAVRLLKGIYLFILNFRKNPQALLKSLNIYKYKKEAVSLSILYKVIPFINMNTYDIIHSHFGPNGLFVVSLKDRGFIKGKVVTSFHGHDMSGYVTSHGNDVYNPLFAKGDLFTPISNYWKIKLRQLGCPEQKILVHRMGIDVNKFCHCSKKHKKGKINILSVARLVEKKGLPYGIEAVATVSKVYQGIEYLIVGDGPLKSSLDDLIKQLKIDGIVKLLGWREQNEIRQLMQETDIFLAPSVTGSDDDQEGIPVAIMEAMALGLPVISTLHSGIPELVKDGVSGFLVSECDIDSLTNRLAYLIDHPEIWSEMGRCGREIVKDRFDINKLNDKLVEIYLNILK
jgi:colanic acid/amylovoran biosynthesis glycosyltransferase